MLIVSICIGIITAALKLILKLRLGIPLIYLILCSTLLAPWAAANETLSTVIFFGLLAAVGQAGFTPSSTLSAEWLHSSNHRPA